MNRLDPMWKVLNDHLRWYHPSFVFEGGRAKATVKALENVHKHMHDMDQVNDNHPKGD